MSRELGKDGHCQPKLVHLSFLLSDYTFIKTFEVTMKWPVDLNTFVIYIWRVVEGWRGPCAIAGHQQQTP